MIEFTVFYIAFFKHSAPQHLVAGSFVDIEKAEYECAKKNREGTSNYVVLEHKITATRVDY